MSICFRGGEEQTHSEFNTQLPTQILTNLLKKPRGSFGIVRLLQHKQTNKTYACKILRKGRGSPAVYEQVQREIAIMKRVNHPHIVQLSEVYETPKKYFLVME